MGAAALAYDVQSVSAQSTTTGISAVSIIGVSGVVAMVGVGVLWGRMEATSNKHDKEIEALTKLTMENRERIVPRSEIDERMGRIEGKIDQLLVLRLGDRDVRTPKT